MKRPDLLPQTFDGALSKFIEETCEANIAIAKIQLHGRNAIDPKTKFKYDNVVDLFLELIDVVHAIEEIYRLYYENHPDESIEALKKIVK